jgi:hypothetical protein
MKLIKKIIKNTWLGDLLKSILKRRNKHKEGFPGSAQYWERRYQHNRTASGSGSYGRLANFKAYILNNFVISHEINTVIEYGTGDGNQLSLANYPNYIGFDVSKTAVAICIERFKNDTTKSFYLSDDPKCDSSKAELTLSLDVLYHLIEDSVFDTYMNKLFNAAERFVIIYSSNYESHFAPHVKCREFTSWIAKNQNQNWALEKMIKNPYPFDEKDPDNTSIADFYIYKKR